MAWQVKVVGREVLETNETEILKVGFKTNKEYLATMITSAILRQLVALLAQVGQETTVLQFGVELRPETSQQNLQSLCSKCPFATGDTQTTRSGKATPSSPGSSSTNRGTGTNPGNRRS